MKKFSLASSFLALLVCFFSIQAVSAEEMEGPSWNRHQGFFAEGTLGYTFVWFAGEIGGSDFAEGDGAGLGWTLGGGYMFRDWVGAEVGYFGFSPEVSDEEEEISIGGGYLAARFNIPIHDRFSVIIKAGLIGLFVSDEEEDYVGGGAPFTGLGAAYAVTDKIDLLIQLQGPNMIILGANVLSGGITYHF